MAFELFESLNIKPLPAATLAALAANQASGHPEQHLEDGALAFDSTNGHIVSYSVSSGTWTAIAGTDGYTLMPNGFWLKKADFSGPYVFDGTTMKLSAHV